MSQIVLVQVSNGYERFWCRLVGKNRAIVNNYTVDERSPRFGETIEFKDEDVRDVVVRRSKFGVIEGGKVDE